MTESPQAVKLRPARAEDREFLLAVFASTRADELALLQADSAQRQIFINLQFSAQQQSYDACYPAAENNLILLEGRPIGRMLVERTAEAMLLVDIAILGEYRNRGIGSSLIRGLMAEAASKRQPLRLSVYKPSPALRLYERLGFSQTADDGVYFAMNWLPVDVFDPSGS